MYAEWWNKFNRYVVVVDSARDAAITATNLIDFAREHDAVYSDRRPMQVLVRFASQETAESIAFHDVRDWLAQQKSQANSD